MLFRSGLVLQRLKAVEDEQAAPLADEAGQALAFLERAGGAGGEGPVRVVAEEGEGFLEEDVGGGGLLFARALAVEGLGKGGVAAGPVFGPHFTHKPFCDQRRFSFTAKGDERQHARAVDFRAQDLLLLLAQFFGHREGSCDGALRFALAQAWRGWQASFRQKTLCGEFVLAPFGYCGRLAGSATLREPLHVPG